MTFNIPRTKEDILTLLRSLCRRIGFCTDKESTASRDWRLALLFGVVVFVSMGIYSATVYTRVADESSYSAASTRGNVDTPEVKTVDRDALENISSWLHERERVYESGGSLRVSVPNPSR